MQYICVYSSAVNHCYVLCMFAWPYSYFHSILNLENVYVGLVGACMHMWLDSVIAMHIRTIRCSML